MYTQYGQQRKFRSWLGMKLAQDKIYTYIMIYIYIIPQPAGLPIFRFLRTNNTTENNTELPRFIMIFSNYKFFRNA